MSTITFYEKPGCSNNTRQKALLMAAGHEVIARNLLTEPWTAKRLLAFFGSRPVEEWINRAAPSVKSGALVPELLDADTALNLMLIDPLLIRRPLMEAEGHKGAGFDHEEIHAWLGLKPIGVNLESCPNSHRNTPCPPAGQ